VIRHAGFAAPRIPADTSIFGEGWFVHNRLATLAMLTVILIRPGSTDFDEQGRIQGTLDVPLNEQGGAEVARLADDLRHTGLETIYHSACTSAQQTAELLATALAVKTKRVDNLQNLNHGLWQGMRVEEVKRKHPKVYRQWQEQPDSVCPPEGETLEAARTRVQGALRKLLRKHREGTMGLVVPEPLARLVRSQLNHSELGNLWTAGEEHGSFEVIAIGPELAAKS
jgi:probable phosphoglycerate mutase